MRRPPHPPLAVICQFTNEALGQVLPVLSSAAGEPYHAAVTQNALSCASVKVVEELRGELGLSEPPKKEKSLLCLLL